MLAENWGDAAETLTDVIRAGAWSMTTGWKHCVSIHNTHGDTSAPGSTHAHGYTVVSILKVNEMKWEKRQKRDITWFLSNKCHQRHSAYFSACRDPGGPREMNICPVDLSHLIQSWSTLLRWRQSHSLCTLKVIG